MQPVVESLFEETSLRCNKKIHFPEGLPAFEDVKEFVLVTNEEELPFLWLQALDAPNLAFVTIDPFVVCPEYRPDIPDDEVEVLKIESQEDVFLLSIVNLKNNQNQGITTNLVGPVVINTREMLAKQIILNNHQQYSVKHLIS